MVRAQLSGLISWETVLPHVAAPLCLHMKVYPDCLLAISQAYAPHTHIAHAPALHWTVKLCNFQFHKVSRCSPLFVLPCTPSQRGNFELWLSHTHATAVDRTGGGERRGWPRTQVQLIKFCAIYSAQNFASSNNRSCPAVRCLLFTLYFCISPSKFRKMACIPPGPPERCFSGPRRVCLFGQI